MNPSRYSTQFYGIRAFLIFVLLIMNIFLVSCGSEGNRVGDPSPPTQIDIPTVGQKLFNGQCATCHLLEKDLVGPALKGVTSRRNKEWLYAFIHCSSCAVQTGDTAAVRLQKRWNGVQMTSFPDLSHQDIDEILNYIEGK